MANRVPNASLRRAALLIDSFMKPDEYVVMTVMREGGQISTDVKVRRASGDREVLAHVRNSIHPKVKKVKLP